MQIHRIIESHKEKLDKGLVIVFCFFLTVFFIKLLVYHYGLITDPYPLEYREGAMLLTTDVMLQGKNPFDFATQPRATNVYGLFYHWIVFPLSKIFGPTLIVHRLVSGLFILASCGIVILFLRRRSVSGELCLSAGGLVYAALLAKNTTTAIAGPHSLGHFLFLATILIPFFFRYSYRSLAVSCVLGVLGFYSKAYYILGIFYLLAFLTLFHPKKKMLFYGIISFLFLAVSVLVVNHFYESYFGNTFFCHITKAGNNPGFNHHQLNIFFQYHREIFIAAALALCVLLFDARKKLSKIISTIKEEWRALKNRINFLALDKPFLSIECPLSLFCLCCSFVIIYVKLGRHEGSWMAYHFQLMTPFLLCFAMIALTRLKKNILLFGIVMILLGANVVRATQSVTKPYKVTLKEWETVEQIVQKHDRILNSPAIVPLLMRHDKEVIDSGQSEYFAAGQATDKISFTPNEKINTIFSSYLEGIYSSVTKKEYDLIVMTRGWAPLIPGEMIFSYDYKGSIEVTMPHSRQKWELTFWQPKK